MPNTISYLLAGVESTIGTPATSMFGLPVTSWDVELTQDDLIPKEHRNSQEEVFNVVPGRQLQNWHAAGYVYNDTIGYILRAASGTDSVTGSTTYTHTFKPSNAPATLTLQYGDSTQAFQSVSSVLDTLTLKWGAKDALTWDAKGLGMPETTISAPTPTYSTQRPFANWMASATLNGSATAKVVAAEISLMRNRKEWYVSDGTVMPNRFLIGARRWSFKATLDFTDTADYVLWKNTSTANLVYTIVDNGVTIGASSHPTMTINLPDVRYTKAKVDRMADTQTLVVESQGVVYNSSAAASGYITLLNTVASY